MMGLFTTFSYDPVNHLGETKYIGLKQILTMHSDAVYSVHCLQQWCKGENSNNVVLNNAFILMFFINIISSSDCVSKVEIRKPWSYPQWVNKDMLCQRKHKKFCNDAKI